MAKKLVVVLLVIFAFEVYFEDEKEVAIKSADEFKRIQSVIVRNDKD